MSIESEPEKNRDSIVQFLKRDIADAYIQKWLSDDNPSSVNGLTSLEQAICFRFRGILIFLDTDTEEEIEYQRRAIYRDVMELVDKDLNNNEIYGNIHTVMEGEEVDYDWEKMDEDPEEEEDKKRIERETLLDLAEFIDKRIVTDDSRSPSSELTALEEILIFELGYMTRREIREKKKRIKKLRTVLPRLTNN